MVRIICTVISLFICFVGYAQNDSTGLGVSFDFAVHSEYGAARVYSQQNVIDKPTHFNYIFGFSYKKSEKSQSGILLGMGRARSNFYSDVHNQNQYFESNSGEFGIFYKYNVVTHNRISAYLQPIIRIMVIKQKSYIKMQQGQAGEYITGSQLLFSSDINFRAGVDYKLNNRFNIGLFLSNDIVSWESRAVDIMPAIVQESAGFVFFKSYIIFGAGVCYQF